METVAGYVFDRRDVLGKGQFSVVYLGRRPAKTLTNSEGKCEKPSDGTSHQTGGDALSCEDERVEEERVGIRIKDERVGDGRVVEERTTEERAGTEEERVAVKVMASCGRSDMARKTLEREMTIVTELSHPHVIKTYHVERRADVHYIVSEYCNAGSLKDLQRHLAGFEGDPREKEEVVKHYYGQLMLALCYLHDMKIVHRDLKPENVLLHVPGRSAGAECGEERRHPESDKDLKKDVLGCRAVIKLADFGFAKHFEGDETMTRSFCGTPLYVSPELLLSDRLSDRCDLWSYGIALYEALCGGVPYKNCRCMADLVTILKGPRDPVNLHRVRQSASTEAADLLSRLLRRRSADRMSHRELRAHRWFGSVGAVAFCPSERPSGRPSERPMTERPGAADAASAENPGSKTHRQANPGPTRPPTAATAARLLDYRIIENYAPVPALDEDFVWINPVPPSAPIAVPMRGFCSSVDGFGTIPFGKFFTSV